MNKQDELRILNNFLNFMPKVYSKRNANSVIVRDILMNGTSTAGQGSCIKKCIELGIAPDGYMLKKLEPKNE